MQITFGKFKGWNTERLAKTTDGRSYLDWGADNLRSPKWRKEFARVLSEISVEDIDLDLEIQAIMANSPELDYQDAEAAARETKVQLIQEKQAMDAFSQAEDTLRKNLIQSGVPVRHVTRLVGLITTDNFEEAVKGGAVQFSSRDKEYAIRSCVAQYEIDADAAMKMAW